MNEFEKLATALFNEAELYIKMKAPKTQKDALKRFYGVMRRFGIKKYTKVESGGMVGNNFAWTMSMTYFFSHIEASDSLRRMFQDPPKDLQAY